MNEETNNSSQDVENGVAGDRERGEGVEGKDSAVVQPCQTSHHHVAIYSDIIITS